MRIVLGIEYIGSGYSGWQKQSNSTETIQHKIEVATSYVANHEVSLFCSGRTDGGVHACCQVAHFDTQSKRTHDQWLRGINSHLPSDINIIWVYESDMNFHARYSAKSRLYHYYISTSKNVTVFDRNFCWNIPYALDLGMMRETAKLFIGEHDFSAFRARKCQAKSPIKNIYVFEIVQTNNMIRISICANSFLYNMVRNLVGTLFMVGSNKKSVAWAASLLKNSDTITKAPAYGLHFMKPRYNNFKLPIQEVYSIFDNRFV